MKKLCANAFFPGQITVTVYADMEKELHETTLFPRKALRPISLARLDNLFVHVLIVAFPIGKSRKFRFFPMFVDLINTPTYHGHNITLPGGKWIIISTKPGKNQNL